jgi:hypothetical protein
MTMLGAHVPTNSSANRVFSSTASSASEGSGRRFLSAVAGVCAFLLLLGAECIPAHAQPNWFQESPATSPPARNYAGLAYDAAQGQVVVFGGAGEPGGRCCGYFGDTWVWNGTNWTQEFPADSPSARGAYGMAYDAAQGQVVLFGGSNGINPLNDTWVWNGTNWTQLSPANSPSARGAFSMVYDAAQSEIVLFGGLVFGAGPETFLADTWVWNGTNWTQEFPANSPPARSDYDMAYDAVHGQVVLFGGVSGNNFLGDTWVWDGTNWTQLSPATSPPARADSPMAYDVALSEAVLFGGDSSGTSLNDTWVWDGTNWTQEFPADSPSARVWADMAYDPQQSQVVLFGGLNPVDGFVNDTWVWGTPQLSVSPTSWNFGGVFLNFGAHKDLTVTNSGTTKVNIGPISFVNITGNADDFRFHNYCTAPLHPGESCLIDAKFFPSSTATEGATLNIQTNSPGSPLLQVSLTGTGRPD